MVRNKATPQCCCRVADARPGLLAQEFLGFWVVDQDLIQIFFVQDEEVGEAVGDDVCRASVTATH